MGCPRLTYYPTIELNKNSSINYLSSKKTFEKGQRDYRFGFNTQEKVDEIAGKGNHNTALFWEYDTRLGRRWNLDPVDQISISNYSVLGDNPIRNIDWKGDKKQFASAESKKENNNNRKLVSPSQAAGEHVINEIVESCTKTNFKRNHSALKKKKPIAGTYTNTGQGGYVSDSKDANKYNLWVNQGLVFNVDESNADEFENYELMVSASLLTAFQTGRGAENWNFPENGIISSKFIGSDILNKALAAYNKNPGVPLDEEFSFGAAELANDFMRTGSLFSITGLVGSANIKIVPNGNNLKIEIFNVTSLTSGAFGKEVDFTRVLWPESFVRDHNSKYNTSYGNISQTFNLSIPDPNKQ